jgi:hypothetical protein
MEDLSVDTWAKIMTELVLLDKEPVEIDGGLLKPSQCYYFGINPKHVLFNTNCPQQLKSKIESIIEKHAPGKQLSLFARNG